MKVLSLFDGMSCGQIALERLGIKVDHYFASEIDKYAIQITQKNYPDTIQLGDARKVKASDLPKIDLLLAGSPCQGFSFAGKGLNFKDERSKLFFEFVRLLKECKTINPDMYFLLENVNMKEEYEVIISKHVGVWPIKINSALVSAQNRRRLYWTNIKAEPFTLFGDMKTTIKQPKDKGVLLNDIIEEKVGPAFYLKGKRLAYIHKKGEYYTKKTMMAFNPDKSLPILARTYRNFKGTFVIQREHGNNKGGLKGGNGKCPSITRSSWEHNNHLLYKNKIRMLTPLECERLQTVPDNYTEEVSDTQRYKCLGNGWTVDVIAYILEHMTPMECW